MTFDKPLNLFKTPFPSGLAVSSSSDAVRNPCQALINLVYINCSINVIIVVLFITIILLLLGLPTLPELDMRTETPIPARENMRARRHLTTISMVNKPEKASVGSSPGPFFYPTDPS